MRVLALAALLLAATPLSALVQPRRINFQGKLIDASTQGPKTGPVTLVLSLYDVPSGGSALYTETQANVAVTNGVFSVQIGTITALPRELFLGASVYLGVTVSGDPGGEMTPRRQLVMSPFAFSANQLSDSSEVRLLAGATYSTFTSAGNLAIPAGISASSASFDNSFTASTGTLLGNAFTVGGSTFVVSAGSVGVGASSPAKMLDVNGPAQFGSTGKSGFDSAGNAVLASGADLSITGAAGFITGQSSFNASAFFGDGSGLTGTGMISSPTVFTANGAWFKSVRNPNYIVVEAIGGGGGGGGNLNNKAAAGGGGGGGAYAIRVLQASALAASETVTVSTGGAGGPAGNNGGCDAAASSFGTWVVADGGSGGQGTAGGALAATAGGAGGLAANSTGDVILEGGGGAPGIVLSATTIAISGTGGKAPRGSAGGLAQTAAAGAVGNIGGGGSGSATITNTNRAGGAGGKGIVIVWEFK